MPLPTTILIVDDDPRLCRTLARYFEREGYRVRMATSGEEMRERMASDPPDLVILDLLLPDEDGFSLARYIRAKSNVPIVILTGKADTTDKIVGLEIGADDYVTKPFIERELLARVHSVLRRSGQAGQPNSATSGSMAVFAGWHFDLTSYELTSPAGEAVELTPHEFRLLIAFVHHGNRILTRDAILELVASREWSPIDRSVDVLIGKLRKKLEQNPEEPQLIKTVRGVGYRFATVVEFR